MGHAFDSEKIILTVLIREPALLEKAPDLCVNAFSKADHKRIFAVIADIWEDRKPDSIDEFELAEKAGITIGELQNITNGCYRVTPERFFDLVSGLLRTRCMEKIVPLVDQEANQLLRTGEYDPTSFDKIRSLFVEYDNLETGISRGPRSIQLAEVEPEPINWLWPNYFPISKINLISGDPGAGKTWFCLDLVARLSTNKDWPDGSPGSGSGSSLILSCEDGAADTFRPRLDKLKADTSKIFLLQNPLDLSSGPGRTALISEIEHRNPKLIIIDPILDFSGRVNPNAVDQVRAMLTPLSEIAERTKAAIILTSHLNKSSVMQAIYRTAGSASGWVGKARAVFLVIKDKEGLEENGQYRRIFAPIKTNLGPIEPQAFFFRISDNPGLTYDQVPSDFDLENLLSSDHRGHAPQQDQAKSFLRETLKSGPVEARLIFRQAKEAGISKKTLERAKGMLNIQAFREGGTNGLWIWGMEE
jgi:hypothetical protein